MLRCTFHSALGFGFLSHSFLTQLSRRVTISGKPTQLVLLFLKFIDYVIFGFRNLKMMSSYGGNKLVHFFSFLFRRILFTRRHHQTIAIDRELEPKNQTMSSWNKYLLLFQARQSRGRGKLVYRARGRNGRFSELLSCKDTGNYSLCEPQSEYDAQRKLFA